jgi:Tfp pilus assembly protein PilV
MKFSTFFQRYVKATSSSRAGFTLIETFVAILVLVFAVVGPLTLTSRSLNATLVTRDELVATYLAQEALEHVRFLRDGSMLRGENWMLSLGSCLGQYCAIDVWDDSLPSTCGNDGCSEIDYDEDTHRYQYGDGDATHFTRLVRIDNTGQADEKTVSIVVEWTSGTREHSLQIRENIFDWASGAILPQ